MASEPPTTIFWSLLVINFFSNKTVFFTLFKNCRHHHVKGSQAEKEIVEEPLRSLLGKLDEGGKVAENADKGHDCQDDSLHKVLVLLNVEDALAEGSAGVRSVDN